ncbi:hypothetical protein BDR04DRAFT_744728 [Suillus decipiens]|nr:hypothetical protein BDR04DRAFT_744728 [Suillus decipiens]
MIMCGPVNGHVALFSHLSRKTYWYAYALERKSTNNAAHSSKSCGFQAKTKQPLNHACLEAFYIAPCVNQVNNRMRPNADQKSLRTTGCSTSIRLCGACTADPASCTRTGPNNSGVTETVSLGDLMHHGVQTSQWDKGRLCANLAIKLCTCSPCLWVGHEY